MISYWYLSVLLIGGILVMWVDTQHAYPKYVIRKDFFNGFKSPEFSVYDSSEKRLHYRIESDFHLLHKLRVIQYPMKTEIARLQSQISLLGYYSGFSIFDIMTKQWVDGTIDQNIKFIGYKFDITWKGHQIRMEGDPISFTGKFFDTDGYMLATFRLRPSSLFWTRKYDMEIFSNKYPEAIYLLGLAARDQAFRKKSGR